MFLCLYIAFLKLTIPGLEIISLNILKIACESENSLIVYIVVFNSFPKYVKSSRLK